MHFFLSLMLPSLSFALPAISFDVLNHDFGVVGQDDKVEYSFGFVNSGDQDLLITKVSSS